MAFAEGRKKKFDFRLKIFSKQLENLCDVSFSSLTNSYQYHQLRKRTSLKEKQEKNYLFIKFAHRQKFIH